MDILKTSKEMLGFVFNRLRTQEGIEKGQITMMMNDELIFKVLVNAKYKQEKGQTLTTLENSVRKESGSFIQMYVSQKWEEAKKEQHYNELPFEEISSLTTSDIARLKTTLRNRIA